MNRCTGGVGDTRARRWCAARRRCRHAGPARWRAPTGDGSWWTPRWWWGGRLRTSGPGTRSAGWPATRVLYIATGAWVLGRRWWEARTNARYERLMRAAEAAGDYERLTDWEQRGEQARERRHRRRMDWITAPLDVARAVAVAVMVGIGFLLGLGGVLAIAHRDTGWLLTPTAEGRGHHRVAGVAARRDLAPVAVALPGLVLAGLWQVGRRHGAVPRWAAPAGGREYPTVIVTPGGIAAALAHLGIPAMNRAVKDGWQVEFATPPVRVNGRGYQSDVLAADGRDPGDDRRQARRAGPQPGPRTLGGVAVRGRPGRLRGSVGGRSGLDRAAGARRTRCCTTGPRTCSPGCRSGCRSAGT